MVDTDDVWRVLQSARVFPDPPSCLRTDSAAPHHRESRARDTGASLPMTTLCGTAVLQANFEWNYER